jgi:hypothetical protein
LARFYPMRMKPSWIVSLDCISDQQHKFTHKYGACFYWVEQQNEFVWKIYTVCFHVGQMLFAGNKYLLLKRITVHTFHLQSIQISGKSGVYQKL